MTNEYKREKPTTDALYIKALEFIQVCESHLRQYYELEETNPEASIRQLEIAKAAWHNAVQSFTPFAMLQKNPDAQYHLGMALLENSAGILNDPPSDRSEATRWITSAANAGHREAEFRLGMLLLEKEDPKESTDWFLKAANQGHAFAQFNLARAYRNGFRGFHKNVAQEFYWVQSAANQGLTIAQSHLGSMYLQGRGVTENIPLALEWFHRAAELGDGVAQYQMANDYHIGNGIFTANLEEAARWYRKGIEAERKKPFLPTPAGEQQIINFYANLRKSPHFFSSDIDLITFHIGAVLASRHTALITNNFNQLACTKPDLFCLFLTQEPEATIPSILDRLNPETKTIISERLRNFSTRVKQKIIDGLSHTKIRLPPGLPELINEHNSLAEHIALFPVKQRDHFVLYLNSLERNLIPLQEKKLLSPNERRYLNIVLSKIEELKPLSIS